MNVKNIMHFCPQIYSPRGKAYMKCMDHRLARNYPPNPVSAVEHGGFYFWVGIGHLITAGTIMHYQNVDLDILSWIEFWFTVFGSYDGKERISIEEIFQSGISNFTREGKKTGFSEEVLKCLYGHLKNAWRGLSYVAIMTFKDENGS